MNTRNASSASVLAPSLIIILTSVFHTWIDTLATLRRLVLDRPVDGVRRSAYSQNDAGRELLRNSSVPVSPVLFDGSSLSNAISRRMLRTVVGAHNPPMGA